MNRPSALNSAVRSFRWRQNGVVIWKSLPWWLHASRNALSRANAKKSRAEFVPMVSSDWPCRSAQYGVRAVRSETRSGFERASTAPPGPSISIRRSPGAATERSSITTENAPGVNRTVSGNPSTVRFARRLAWRSHWSLGLPQASSPFRHSRKRSPTTRPVGRIAFHRTGGAGTIAISGLTGSAT